MSLDVEKTPRKPRSRSDRRLPVGPIVGVLMATAIGIAEPAIVQGTLGSPRALAILAGVVAATVGWSTLLRRWAVPAWGRALAVGVPLAILGWFAVAPYFMPDEVVDEAFPPVVVPDAPPQPTAAPAPVTPTPDAPSPDTAPDPSPGGGAGSPAPTAAVGAGDDATEAPPPGPVELSRGTFVGLDGHFAEGQAAVYDLGDGRRIVRLEDVDLQRVPDPYVYLVPGLDQSTPIAGSFDLGALAGNVGSSNYDIPPEADLNGDWTVLVWCEPFSSPVGAASQTPPA